MSLVVGCDGDGGDGLLVLFVVGCDGGVDLLV